MWFTWQGMADVVGKMLGKGKDYTLVEIICGGTMGK